MCTLQNTLNRLHQVVHRLSGQAEITQWEKGADELYKEKDYIRNREMVSQFYNYLRGLKNNPFFIKYAGYDDIELIYRDARVEVSHVVGGFKVYYDCFDKEEHVYDTENFPLLTKTMKEKCESMLHNFYSGVPPYEFS